jgi:predicted GTPase
MDEADGALFMIDAKAGLTPADELLADILRKARQAGCAGRQQGRGQGL